MRSAKTCRLVRGLYYSVLGLPYSLWRPSMLPLPIRWGDWSLDARAVRRPSMEPALKARSIAAQGNALGRPSRNPSPPCKGGSSCFSPKGSAHRMPSHSASTTLGVLPERICAGDAPPAGRCRISTPVLPTDPSRRLRSQLASGMAQAAILGFSTIWMNRV